MGGLGKCEAIPDEIVEVGGESAHSVVDEGEDDLLLLKYLKNVTNRIQKLFS